jgi:hypothetical protein
MVAKGLVLTGLVVGVVNADMSVQRFRVRGISVVDAS